MNPIEYVESVKERLSTDFIVINFDVIREFANLDEGYIRVRANLTNDDILDFSELIKQANDLELVSYRYQWLDKNKKHIRRWDNAMHYPKLNNFPHHIHTPTDEAEEEITAAELVHIQMMISLWQRAWEIASQNPQQRLLLSVQAKDWSDKAVDFSGLIKHKQVYNLPK